MCLCSDLRDTAREPSARIKAIGELLDLICRTHLAKKAGYEVAKRKTSREGSERIMKVVKRIPDEDTIALSRKSVNFEQPVFASSKLPDPFSYLLIHCKMLAVQTPLDQIIHRCACVAAAQVYIPSNVSNLENGKRAEMILSAGYLTVSSLDEIVTLGKRIVEAGMRYAKLMNNCGDGIIAVLDGPCRDLVLRHLTSDKIAKLSKIFEPKVQASIQNLTINAREKAYQTNFHSPWSIDCKTTPPSRLPPSQNREEGRDNWSKRHGSFSNEAQQVSRSQIFEPTWDRTEPVTAHDVFSTATSLIAPTLSDQQELEKQANISNTNVPTIYEQQVQNEQIEHTAYSIGRIGNSNDGYQPDFSGFNLEAPEISRLQETPDLQYQPDFSGYEVDFQQRSLRETFNLHLSNTEAEMSEVHSDDFRQLYQFDFSGYEPPYPIFNDPPGVSTQSTIHIRHPVQNIPAIPQHLYAPLDHSTS
ncbi:MAG: hypothetical protein M1835_008160 [Candelina submexicana]|nr:MAG: hypothetical protein M1835_008160 [Candelina submexicana]